MSAIDNIRENLRANHVSYQETKDSICVPALSEDGFEVCLGVGREGYYVSAKKWHEECGTEDEALAWFTLLLSNEARLKVESRGGFEYKWTVEIDRGEEWAPASLTSYLFYPFWMKKRVEFLQNELLTRDGTGEPATT